MESRLDHLIARQSKKKWPSCKSQWSSAKPRIRSWIFNRIVSIRKQAGYELDTAVFAMRVFDKFIATRNDFSTISYSVQLMYLYLSACMLISSKYHETDFLSLDELVFFSDNRFTTDQLAWAETVVLTTIDYDIVFDTEIYVLYVIRDALNIDDEVDNGRRLTEFICCIVIHSIDVVDFSPVRLATAVVGFYSEKVAHTSTTEELRRLTNSETLMEDILLLENICRSMENRLTDEKDKELLGLMLGNNHVPHKSIRCHKPIQTISQPRLIQAV